MSISYGDSVEAARAKILEILRADSRVVEKYVEDDRSRRRAEANEKKQEEIASGIASAPEEKKPLKGWKRFFSRKREEAIKKLEDDSDMMFAFEKKEVDRSPSVRVAALASSSVDLKVTAWTFTDNYWGLFYDINEKILAELPDAGINFPFPQLDVHVTRPGSPG